MELGKKNENRILFIRHELPGRGNPLILCILLLYYTVGYFVVISNRVGRTGSLCQLYFRNRHTRLSILRAEKQYTLSGNRNNTPANCTRIRVKRPCGVVFFFFIIILPTRFDMIFCFEIISISQSHDDDEINQ